MATLGKVENCYHLSMRLNCSCGTCSSLVIWWPRCTIDAWSGTRHTVLSSLHLIVSVVVTLNGKAPDVSHLKVFGYSAYVHIPKETCANGLAPKSELMAYLGHTEGIKVFKFMCLLNNTLYHSTTALFDETLFPKCSTLGKKRGTTRISELHASQLPIEPVKDTTPGDYDLPTPHTPKQEEPVLD